MWPSWAAPGSPASYRLVGCLPVHRTKPHCQVRMCRVQGRRQTLAFKSFAELKPELEGFRFRKAAYAEGSFSVPRLSEAGES